MNTRKLLETARHIVIEGPIGVGKTSLTHRLATHLNAQAFLEHPETNPFLSQFYQDPARYALPTQLFFLFQRIDQLRELNQPDFFGRRIIADYLLEKDPIFAQLTLSDDEYSLYQHIYERLAPHAPTPDLVIYLQAEPATLLQRIHRRNIDIERKISDDYLTQLVERYSQFFYHYTAAPLLIVNAEHLNFVDHDEDFHLLLERISTLRGQRGYFNRGE